MESASAPEDSPTASPWRTIAVVLICLFCLLYAAPDIALPWRPTATFGFTVDVVGTIVGVSAGTPAARAHLAKGERIDFARTPPDSRLYLSPGSSNNVSAGKLGAFRYSWDGDPQGYDDRGSSTTVPCRQRH